MKRPQKVTFVQNLTGSLEKAKSLVLVDPTGLPVKQQEILRRRLSEVGGTVSVTKNTLLLRALRQITNYKSQITEIEPSLTGQTAVIIANEDELAPLQILGKFIKEFDLPKLKVGIVGREVQNTSNLLALARLPGQVALRAQVVASLMGPMYGLVGTLQSKMQELVYILNARANSGGGESN